MWDRIDTLLERAPHLDALRHHRVELLEAGRRRAAGLDAGPLAIDETMALACRLAAVPILNRVREAWDGPLVLVKGPEVASDYPEARLRRFRDLDLLTDDPERAQAALIAAGFREVDDPAIYRDIHHLRPLWWPGLPLVVELHSRPKWPDRLSAPPIEELLGVAVPGRLGVPGIDALPPEYHTLVLVAHAWAHQPLGRLGDLIDVAVTLRRSDAVEVAALARRWSCRRIWRATESAVRAVLEGDGSAAVPLWARHLADVRERTVLEWHVQELLAPIWGLPAGSALAAVLVEVGGTFGREGREPWLAKARRARLAVRNAGRARSDHVLALHPGDGRLTNKEAG